jgi:hypothetical protein
VILQRPAQRLAPRIAVDRVRPQQRLYYLVESEGACIFLGSEEYQAIFNEIDDFGSRYFPRDHRPPENGSFSRSSFLEPIGDLLRALEEEYERARYLYYGERPTLREILDRLLGYEGKL